ncbi:MAG: PSD1 and planctomycete cytochrome C domain-containing protein [Planctomycetaceae bacterium]
MAVVQASDDPDTLRMDPEQIFAFQIHTLLVNKCFACHGADVQKIEGELDLTTRAGMMRGGASGESSVFPEDAVNSPLLQAALRDSDSWAAMPPKESERLTSVELGYFKDWIDAGAPWPSEQRLKQLQRGRNPWGTGNEIRVATSGGLSEEWTNRTYEPGNIWAFQPIAKPDLPDNDGVHPVDHFIQTRMPVGLKSALEADPITLIRRLSYTLTGLPPTPEQIDRFVSDRSAEAYENLIDRYLASERYGEQWGKHWLDVVRYADSSGFANDYERPNAWRYRDYVIRSFNQDKPYDQFVKEQLAADELYSDSPEALLGLGFLRMGPWEHTGMSVGRITRQQYLDDVTSSVGQVFMGQALQCARCHDHKFDPVPTRDYYAVQSVFATTQMAELPTPFLPYENTEQFEEDKKYLAKREAAIAELRKTVNNPNKTADDFGRARLSGKWSNLYQRARDRYEPLILGVYNGHTQFNRNSSSRFDIPDDVKNGLLESTAILTGGNVFTPGLQVTPGVLSATGVPAAIPQDLSGRRSAFSMWLTDPANPLTARVLVNRVWSYHFGRGLAGNPNNFGATGEKPTHPQLLDWLAAEFMNSGWSVKHLHKLILTSATYRRSSQHPQVQQLNKLDPARASYAVFNARRLTSEELRDSMLMVSGELEYEMGGLPARPDMNIEAALQPRQIMGSFAPSYVPNVNPQQRNRRTVYVLKLRGLRDPFMTTFNQPSPDESCEMRDASNVTPQVFALFNSEESADRALAFAQRVISGTSSDTEAIEHAFQLAFGRLPQRDELKAVKSHWQQCRQDHMEITPVKREYPTEVVRRANEENTGEEFTFTETLFEYQDYKHDLQPHDVDVRTRAFAEICLVLLNANEFVYIY